MFPMKGSNTPQVGPQQNPCKHQYLQGFLI
jgi:hypothetical protein